MSFRHVTLVQVADAACMKVDFGSIETFEFSGREL